MVSWQPDKGIRRLATEWQTEHPGAVVYFIGDTSHSTNPDVSQHAPEKDGDVDAGDFMPGKGGVTMPMLREFRDRLVESRDKRLLYLIIDNQIVSSVVSPWKIRPYTGKKHTHLHVSVNDNFENDDSDWKWEKMADREYTFREIGGSLPELRIGDEDRSGSTTYIKRVQRLLGVDDDGVYGPNTAAALRARMAGQTSYAPSSTNGSKIYEPEWRVLYGLWK